MKWQRAQQQCVNYAENTRVCANADGQRRNRQSCMPRTAGPKPQRVLEILKHLARNLQQPPAKLQGERCVAHLRHSKFMLCSLGLQSLSRSPRSSFAGEDGGNTLNLGAGIGLSPMRSSHKNLFSTALSAASAWLKSRFFPSFHSLVLISYSKPLSRLR